MDNTRDAIITAFRGVAKPRSVGDIVDHACEECDGLAKSLLPHSFDAVPPTAIQANLDGLPLLSPHGLHYYLPAWLLHSLEVPGSVALPFAIAHLTPSAETYARAPEYFEQRFSRFDELQRRAIGLFFADVIRHQLCDGFGGELDRARDRWPIEA